MSYERKTKIFIVFIVSLLILTVFPLLIKFYWIEFEFKGEVVGRGLIAEERIKYHFVLGKVLQERVD